MRREGVEDEAIVSFERISQVDEIKMRKDNKNFVEFE